MAKFGTPSQRAFLKTAKSQQREFASLHKEPKARTYGAGNKDNPRPHPRGSEYGAGVKDRKGGGGRGQRRDAKGRFAACSTGPST
jgi:hypothetical protein